MAVGSGSNAVPGYLETNAPQSATNQSNVPAVILDDPVNGSVALHLGGRGTAPTAAPNAHAGTGATASLGATATDMCGTLTLVTGSGSWAGGVQATITLGTALQVAGHPVFYAADDTTASLVPTLQPYATMTGKTAFNLAFHAADSAAHTLTFYYHLLGQ